MNENRHKILKSSFGVAMATLFSRILGLGRVMLEARVLGGGTLASAWVLAFMVPNLFRRILGEGALGSALIPLLTGIEEKEGDREVRYNLTVVFAALSAILLIIVLVTSLAAIAADVWISPHISAEYEHVKLAIKVLPVLMPYALFICIIGIAGSILNSKRVFFLPALGALLLNIMLILAMLILRHIGNQSPMHILNSLGWTVIAAGVVHLLLLIVLLKRNNRLPLFKLQAVKNSRMLRNLWHLTLPGIIGASATQVSFIIDRALAAFIGPEAAPALNYTERVVYLPIGVFALALGSVLLTDMARAAARDDKEEFLDDLVFGLRQVYFVCIPLAAFVIFFRTEIISFLFFGGNFNESNLQATCFATLFYSIGIPVFCAQKVIIPAFHSRKEMKTPLKVALVAIVFNIIMNLILMWPLKQGGIALATVLAAMLNNFTLIVILKKQGFMFSLKPAAVTIVKALIAAAVATTAARLCYSPIMSLNIIIWKQELVPLAVSGIIFSIVYTIISIFMKCPEIRENLNILRRRRK